MALRIATFNLENLDDGPDLDPPLAARVAILRPQLLRLEADVLCLQEVNGQKLPAGGPRVFTALDQLLENTPYYRFHRAATTRADGAGPADKHNLVVLSRWPIVAEAQIRHDTVSPPRYGLATAQPPAPEPAALEWERPLQHVTVAIDGARPLHVLNLHLKAPLAAPVPGGKRDANTWRAAGPWAEGYFIATVKRAGQALEARLRIEAIFDQAPDALIAVCGDLNAEEREAPLRMLLAEAEETGNGALAARQLIALEHSLPASQRFSVLHHGRKVMLDHILVSRGLMAHYRHIEIHNEALGDELVAYATASRSPESYHAPVVAAFDLAAG